MAKSILTNLSFQVTYLDRNSDFIPNLQPPAFDTTVSPLYFLKKKKNIKLHLLIWEGYAILYVCGSEGNL